VLPEYTDAVRRMVGGNGARVFGLDLDELVKTAARIGAPSLRELSEPIGFEPTFGQGGILAFRSVGPWG
jgi:hypothetical protein